MVRITPLLNVHRTEYELKQKSVSTALDPTTTGVVVGRLFVCLTLRRAFQDELEQLRNRVDKLEQERSQLKMDNDRLEQRVSGGGGSRVRTFSRSFRRLAIGQKRAFRFPLRGAAPRRCLFIRATDI